MYIVSRYHSNFLCVQTGTLALALGLVLGMNNVFEIRVLLASLVVMATPKLIILGSVLPCLDL
jgi:hypothetical protein